ncbi:ATP-binding protein [Streptomyces sp. NPDC001817]|uniref:sensor histidine kinase n=1 Tax=Streptomyces sp. NPDC001817 TaxID=3154398 RepID=UPI003328FF51
MIEIQRQLALQTQCLFRITVILFFGVEFLLFLPHKNTALSITLLSGYAAWAVFLFMSATRRTLDIQAVWWTVILDLVILASLLTASGAFSDTSWSSPLMDGSLALVPIMAAFQFRARFTLTISVCTAALYVTGIGIGQGNGNPYWDHTSAQALFILLVAAGCALLSKVQRIRVRMIGMLFRHRAWLLARVMSVEERERDELAETLHDGALQNVLAARFEIDEAIAEYPCDALLRAARALEDATEELRLTVASLHSEILETQGIAAALRRLAERTTQRSGIDVRVDCAIATARSADRMLHRTATELLNNVVKHSNAKIAHIRLSEPEEGWARLEVLDDGIGISPSILREKATSGHIGISSHRSRVEGVGGTFTLRNNSPTGTAVEVTVPMDQINETESPLQLLAKEMGGSAGLGYWLR